MSDQLGGNESRHTALFNQSATPVFIAEPETLAVIEANPAAAEYYGLAQEDIIGLTLGVVTGGDEDEIRARVESALVDGVSTIEIQHRRSDGSQRDAEIQIGVMAAGGRALLSLVIVDVTEQNQAYRDLKRYRDNLEKIVEARTAELERTNHDLAEASRAKSQFLANMSHELRTPLNSIIGFTGIMLQGLTGDLTEEQTRQLGMVNQSGKHLLELINAVLDLSKIEAGRMSLDVEETDVCEVVHAVLETLGPLAREQGLELRRDCDADVSVSTDEMRLRQIVLNLVGNAVKFTSDGTVTVTVTAGADAVRVAVADTGPGISPGELPHVFEEFRQLAPSAGTAKTTGTGLGLPVSLRLAQLLGGDIEAQSTLGLGSTFTLSIPRSMDESYAPIAKRTPPSPRSTGSRVVLLVDDDPSFHDLVGAYLAGEGVRILHAYDLEAAARLVRRQAVSLIVLDLEFEEGTGWELLETIRRDRSLEEPPVIVCTVRDERAQMVEWGVSAFLLKPVDRESLVDEVRRVLGMEQGRT